MERIRKNCHAFLCSCYSIGFTTHSSAKAKTLTTATSLSFLLVCIWILPVQGFPWGPAERLLSPIWRGFRGCSKARGGGSLQMKGRWKSNINVWFPFMYSQKWNCYLQNRIIMFCLPIPTLIHLWEIHIFPGSICLFCCREICRPILGIYTSLTDTCMWELGLRPCNSQKMNT